MSLFKTKVGFSIDGKTSIIQGTDAPSAGAGVSAPVSSIYLRNIGDTNAEIWQKTGSADNAWSVVSIVASQEDPFQNTFIGKGALGTELPNYGTPVVVANNDNLETAIGKIDTKVGANPTPVSRTKFPIVGTDPVQTNISKLDSEIGSDLANTNYAKSNQTINQNISAIDGQVKANSDSITSLQTGQHWISAMQFITSENLSARSGLAHFTDDDAPYTLPVAGDRVVSTFDKKLYIASAGVWVGGTLLTAGDTFFVDNDMLATSDFNEKTSAYNYNGTSLVRQATFDFEAADSINLTAGYTPASGNPIPSESVQSAIQKIDGNTDAINTSVGIAQGDTTLGNWTGSGATRILANATESAKTAVQKVANDIGAVAGGSGDYASAQSVNANINAIDAVLTESHKKVAVNNIPSDTQTTIDTLDLSGNIRFVEWDITIVQSSTPANRYSSKVRAIASASGSDYTEFAILTIGSAIANVAIVVDASTLATTTLKVQATATGGFHCKVTRRTGLVA